MLSIAILFHLVGFAGIVFFNKSFFAATGLFHMALMFGLLLLSTNSTARNLWLCIAACFITGMLVEIVGVHTGWLFGNYQYENMPGPSVYGVPLIIGLNWFISIYCAGISAHSITSHFNKYFAGMNKAAATAVRIFIAASLTVLLDVLLEPVAIALHWWRWLGDGKVPVYNYICWWLISAVLLILFEQLKLSKENKFAPALLIIQLLFFFILQLWI